MKGRNSLEVTRRKKDIHHRGGGRPVSSYALEGCRERYPWRAEFLLNGEDEGSIYR